MAEDKKTNEKKQRLLALLREMFQLDQPDLDFGLYRIMHAKRGQVEAFLETEFDQLIDKVFADRGARHGVEAKKEYEAARQQAIEFGAPDPDAAPKVQQARARYEVVRLTGGEDAEIYDHLHRFFSRYYDQGDFMSLRRYGKGAAGGAETYAVPYDGSEVVLHWANKDQYYIKTTENFAEFSFDPRKALQKDERGISRSLFDDDASKVGAGGTAPSVAFKVHFRIVEASEGSHNNVKASDKDERYFILDAEAPLAWDGNELVVRINYRTDSEKTGQKAKWQDKRNEQLVQTLLDTLKGLQDGGNTLAGEYYAVLAREVRKGKDKKQPLLARYVGQYTASNTMDYFIHKDLGGFLRRELDFYLKNEVLKLDDFVGGEDADVQAGLTDARMKAMKEAMEKAQAIRLLSQRLIDFLAQLEDFQKKLWLKKKFVVETQYCITLDRIPEKFLPEIAANERQREEWVDLYAIDRIAEDTTTIGYSNPLTPEFLRGNKQLVVDTRHFSSAFEEALISAIDGLSDQLNGTLLHSDNFQALNLILERHAKDIGFVYIDPPYNTDATPILYKNNYKESSWLSLIQDRLLKVQPLQGQGTALCIAIDDTELDRLSLLLRQLYGTHDIHRVIVNHYPGSGSGRSNVSRTHEYAMFVVDRSVDLLRGDSVDAGERERNFRRSGTGENNYRTGRQNSFYAVLVDPATREIKGVEPPPQGSQYPTENTIDGYVRIYPIGEDGSERVWTLSYESASDAIRNGLLRCTERMVINRIYTDAERRNLLPSLWDATKFSAVSHGTNLLKDLFGSNDKFSYPKSLFTVDFSIEAATYSRPNATVLDFFGGSGTTAHAVIHRNRVDGGQRKYILAEMGDHFYSVILPRVKKAIYSRDWKDGVPVSRSGSSHIFKYLSAESYEDCLNNIVINNAGEAIVQASDSALQRDYILRYMLDVETQGSQSLLNVAQFRDPTAYQLEIKKPGSDEREKRNVDLVETFNWLIGLHVDKLHAGRRFTATFARVPDPLLPEDANTRLQVETLTEAADGAWWFRPVEGYVRTKPGDDRHRQSVLVLWRTLTDDPEQDAAALEAFLSQQMKFDPTRREDKTLYDIIYINGTHNLPSLGKYGEVRLLEEEFHRRMWAGAEN